MRDSNPAQGSTPNPDMVKVAAVVLCGLFLVGHAALVFLAVPTFQRMFVAMGGQLPVVTQLVINFFTLAPVAVLLLGAIDVAAFAMGYRLARRAGGWYLLIPVVVCLACTLALVAPLYVPQFGNPSALF